MTGPTPLNPITPELSAHLLHEARHKFADLMSRRNHRPLWNASFTSVGLGVGVFIEILPNLVFRVKDRSTNETLAQTVPVSFGPRDPSNLDLAERFEQWCAERRGETVPAVAESAGARDAEEGGQS